MSFEFRRRPEQFGKQRASAAGAVGVAAARQFGPAAELAGPACARDRCSMRNVHDPESAPVVDYAVGFVQVGVAGDAGAVVSDPTERQGRGARKPRRPLLVELNPAVCVPVSRNGAFAEAVVHIEEFDIILVEEESGVQVVERIKLPGESSKGVDVGRRAGNRINEETGDKIQSAAPCRHRPVATAVRNRAVGHRAGVEGAERKRAGQTRRRDNRPHVDDAAHAVAVAGRIAAGIDLDRLHDAGIETREDALEVPQVERFQKFDAIEQEQRLVAKAAAHVRHRRDADRARPGQTVDDAKSVVADRRDSAQCGSVEDMTGHPRAFCEVVPACRDYHFGDAGF